jgi:molybdate transport system regulatory protein
MTDNASGPVDFVIRSKLWIEDKNGKVVFGLGRYRILDAIRRLGSLQAAAAELKMSYRAVWMRVRASEIRMGRRLVIREGRGSRLTPCAEDLMKQFRRLQTIVLSECDEVYEDLMADHLDPSRGETGKVVRRGKSSTTPSSAAIAPDPKAPR